MNNRWRQVRRVRRQEAAKQMRRAREIFEASIKYRDAVYAGLDAIGEAVSAAAEAIAETIRITAEAIAETIEYAVSPSDSGDNESD